MAKNCIRCGSQNPPSSARGVKERSYCSKKCSHAAWIEKNADRRAEHQARYDNSDRGRAATRQWAADHAEHIRGQKRRKYTENRDVFLARAAIWQAANPAKAKVAKRTYAATERGKQKAHESRWARIAREHAAVGSFTKADFLDLCATVGQRCLNCQRVTAVLEADHVMPLALGGTNTLDNIQPLCRTCNAGKGASFRDYRQEFALQPTDLFCEAAP